MAQSCQMAGIMLAVLVIAVCQIRGETGLFTEYFCKAGLPWIEIGKLRKCLKTNGTTIQVVQALWGQQPHWKCKGSTSSCYHDYTCRFADKCNGKDECKLVATQNSPCGNKTNFLQVKYRCIHHRSEQIGPCIRGVCYEIVIDGLLVVKCHCGGSGFTGPTCGIDNCAENGPCTRGKCFKNGTGDPNCNCNGTGFHGPKCIIDKCDSHNPCVNGECINNEDDTLSCDCSGTGYTDDNCITECHCNNRSESCDKVCLSDCLPGWKGKNCQTRDCSHKDYCGIHTCEELDGDFNCSCLDGYEKPSGSQRCEDVDECDRGDACDIHTCRNTNGSFDCICRNESYVNINHQICGAAMLSFDQEAYNIDFLNKEQIQLLVAQIGLSTVVSLFMAVIFVLCAKTVVTAIIRFVTTKPYGKVTFKPRVYSPFDIFEKNENELKMDDTTSSDEIDSFYTYSESGDEGNEDMELDDVENGEIVPAASYYSDNISYYSRRTPSASPSARR